MVTGFVVESDRPPPGNVVEAYMQARETLLGYPQRPPQLKVPGTTMRGAPATQLRNAPPGLVETQQEADTLRNEMQEKFPQYEWTVRQMTYNDAVEIDWGR